MKLPARISPSCEMGNYEFNWSGLNKCTQLYGVPLYSLYGLNWLYQAEYIILCTLGCMLSVRSHFLTDHACAKV